MEDLERPANLKLKACSHDVDPAVFDYLRKRRRKKIADAYQQAYGGRRATDVDWIGWTGPGAWPDE